MSDTPKMLAMARRIEGMEYVRLCNVCEGEGSYDQQYTAGCGGGYYTMRGKCDYCGATGLIYKPTGNAPPVSVLRQMQAAEDQVERVAKAIAKADGLDFDEVCGVEADPEEGYCDSGTCVAALYEDHDPDHARGVYMRQARAALAAMDREPGVYQSAADCPLGDAHGMASTHGRASDGVDCCDFCGFPSQPAPQDGEDQCPFCGSSDNFIERADFSSCYVTCNECGAHGPTSCDETEEAANATENDECEPGERPARRLWQTRHREQSIAELRAENEPLLQLISTVREHLADGEIGAAIVAIDKFTRPERQALSGQGEA